MELEASLKRLKGLRDDGLLPDVVYNEEVRALLQLSRDNSNGQTTKSTPTSHAATPSGVSRRSADVNPVATSSSTDVPPATQQTKHTHASAETSTEKEQKKKASRPPPKIKRKAVPPPQEQPQKPPTIQKTTESKSNSMCSSTTKQHQAAFRSFSVWAVVILVAVFVLLGFAGNQNATQNLSRHRKNNRPGALPSASGTLLISDKDDVPTVDTPLSTSSENNSQGNSGDGGSGGAQRSSKGVRRVGKRNTGGGGGPSGPAVNEVLKNARQAPPKFSSLRFWAKERFANETPAGYHSSSCTAKPREHKWKDDYSFSFDGNSSSAAAAAAPKNTSSEKHNSKSTSSWSSNKCLRVPRSSPSRRDRLKREVFAQFIHQNATHKNENTQSVTLWPSEFQNEPSPAGLSARRSRKHFGKYKGVRLLAILGRDEFMTITARAIRRMLIPNGGVVCHVTIMCFWHQNETVKKMVYHVMKLPPNMVTLQVWGEEQYQFWDFTRLYKDAQDDYLHIKLDDDLFFISHDYDLLLAHAFLFPEDHQRQNQKAEEDINTIADCDIVSANVVNHHWLTSIHQQMGSINFLLDRPLKLGYHVKHSDYGFPAIWGLMHRSFLRTLRNGNENDDGGVVSDAEDSRNVLEKFDFGLHDFNCDGQKRRWSINSFIFGWDRKAVGRIPHGDEEYISTQIPFGMNGRGKACALGEAIAVHSMFQHQSLWHLRGGIKTLEEGKERLRIVYEAVAKHMDGVEPCCESNGCPLYAEAVLPKEDGINTREELGCEDLPREVPQQNSSDTAASSKETVENNNSSGFTEMLQCTFPFRSVAVGSSPTDSSTMTSMAQFLSFAPGGGGGGGGKGKKKQLRQVPRRG